MASIVVDQAGQKVVVPLTEAAVGIGRDHKSNDLVLSFDEISRKHARIFRSEDSWMLEDLKSKCGTQLNRRKLLPEQPVPLSHDDQILIGPCRLIFRNEEEKSGQRRRNRSAGFEFLYDSQSSVLGSMSASDSASESLRPQEKLNGILKINAALAGNVDFHAICPRVLDTLLEIFPQADRGAILFIDESAADELVPVAQAHRRHDDSRPMRICRTILRIVRSENSAILSENTLDDPRVADSESILAETIQSTMCVPMLGLDGKAFGIVSLDSQNPLKRFTPEDLPILVAVANQASHAFENARLLTVYLEKQKQDEEMQLSAKVQRELIPDTLPQSRGYRFFGSYDAAKTVGGDYFDCFEMPDGKICVSFGDVSGKGFPAALIMARLSGIVRNTMNFTNDVSLAMCQINRLMCNNMVEGRFVTYILGVMDPETHTFTFVNAGHIPPEVRSPDGRLSNPGTDHSSFPIGIDPACEYETSSLQLAPGAIVFLRTDGVDDAMSHTGEFYGEHRFREVLRSSAAEPELICRTLLADLKSFAANQKQHDDITMLSFGRMI